MRLLMEFAVILGLPFMFASAPETQNTYTPSKGQYCNGRFEFCVSYPATLLPEQRVSDNDDGVLLRTSDHLSEVSVNGSFNVLQWSPKELYKFSLESLDSGKDVKVVSSEFGDDFYECYFLGNDGMTYYHRAFFIKDFYILLIAKVPANQPETMERLREEVAIVFQT